MPVIDHAGFALGFAQNSRVRKQAAVTQLRAATFGVPCVTARADLHTTYRYRMDCTMLDAVAAFRGFRLHAEHTSTWLQALTGY